MHKFIAIAAAAAIGAVVGITVSKSGHTPDAEHTDILLMPSIAQMMSDARNLPMTPLVSP
jgi:hypothetical protein